MNPNNGEILAMASYPTFDLNNPRDLSARFTPEQLAALPEEAQVEELSKLWKNFCVSNTYEPGSTFKPFTVATALEIGSINGDETYMCDGKEIVSEHEIHCVNRDGHGLLTVEGSLLESCNDALMQIVRTVGPDTFYDFQSDFGFGQKTTIDLPNEASTKNLVYTKDELRRIESNLATNSFGQNFNVTMIQLASAYSSLINGGYLYQPHVVGSMLDSHGNKVYTNNPVVLKKTVSSDVSEILKKYMLHVVEVGTATGVQVEGYNIGGKTGTAETIPRDKINYVVSFMGYAPADNPEIAIYVVVDRPNTTFQDDAKFATRIVRNILTETLPYLNIYMTEELSESEKAELEALNISIKKANIVEEEEENPEEVPEPEVLEDGTIDANGGDTTSSIPVSEEEMQSNNVDTAPLTGTLLDPEENTGSDSDEEENADDDGEETNQGESRENPQSE